MLYAAKIHCFLVRIQLAQPSCQDTIDAKRVNPLKIKCFGTFFASKNTDFSVDAKGCFSWVSWIRTTVSMFWPLFQGNG